MSTAQSVIEAALRSIDQLHPGYSASSDHLNACLEALNRMLDEWAASGVMVFQLSKDIVSGTGTGAYIWGTGADITSVKPVKLKPTGQCVNNTTGILRPFRFVLQDEFAGTQDDGSASGYTDMAWYDYGLSNGVLNVFPKLPSGYELRFYSYKPVS